VGVVPRPKDVHAGSFVVKTRGKRKYVYLVRRVGKEVFSVYVGLYHDEGVLRRFISYHEACVQRLEGRLAVHRQCLELARKSLEMLLALKASAQRGEEGCAQQMGF
jgi:hypothetical protein